MTSAEKESRKTAKFNYLTGNNIKQQLLGRYERLTFQQPSTYKRNYDVSVAEKNKQNMKDNASQDFIDESKYLAKDVVKNLNERSTVLNQRLVSFRKNRIEQGDKIFLKEKLDQKLLNVSKNREGQKQNNNKQNIGRVRNKSFGNISCKKVQLNNSQQYSHKKRGIQFSPYQEQELGKQLSVELDTNKFKAIELQRLKLEEYCKPQAKLLIYELQEQQSIIKQQLTEYQYQNQLLRQKIQYISTQNLQLKEQTQQYANQLKSQQSYYQQLLDTQSINITQMHSQIQLLNQKNTHYQTLINQDKFLIKDLQHQIQQLSYEIHTHNSQLNEFQALLSSKQQIIQQMKHKIQSITFSNHENQMCNYSSQLGKRRKSLDFSTHIKKSPPKESNRRNLLNTSALPNISQPLSSIQENRKAFNFIECIKSMYFKITNKQSKDLKQLWKWLKFIAHQYQSFSQLYHLKDSILTVLDTLQTKYKQQDSQKQQSYLQEEYNIIKKIAQIVNKNVN